MTVKKQIRFAESVRYAAQEKAQMIYRVACSKCGCKIETITEPKTTGFLCNSCHLQWKAIEKKMVGHSYQDELEKAFMKFVNERPWTVK